MMLGLYLGGYYRYPSEKKDINLADLEAAGKNGTATTVIAVKQTPGTYRRLNDALTIMTGLLAIILVVKNTLLGRYTKVNILWKIATFLYILWNLIPPFPPTYAEDVIFLVAPVCLSGHSFFAIAFCIPLRFSVLYP